MVQNRIPRRVGKLLDADAHNENLAPDLMENLHPWSLQAFDDTSKMFSLLVKKLGEWPAEAAVDGSLRDMARAAGLTEEELIQRLQADRTDIPAGAKEAYARLWTFRVCKMVVLACQRYWAWASADLFRLRISSAIGYLRLEAESVGLLKLFMQDDAVAERWSRIRSETEGRAFFRETQASLKTELNTFDLSKAYNIASTTAQHVRMNGIVRAISMRDGNLGLPDQDVDPEDSYSYHLAVAHFHRTQAKVLTAIATTLPDVEDDEWREAFRKYAENADLMWAALERRYAAQIRENEIDYGAND